jgi:hypothetical protein
MPSEQHHRDSAAPDKQAYWRSFPLLERLLEEENPPLLDRIKATCQQLDGILKSGSPQEKARAQHAITGYARALELFRDLVNRRDQAVAEISNRGRASHDK